MNNIESSLSGIQIIMTTFLGITSIFKHHSSLPFFFF